MYLDETAFTSRDLHLFPRLKVIEAKDFLLEICKDVGDKVEVIGCNDVLKESFDNSNNVDDKYEVPGSIDVSSESNEQYQPDYESLTIEIVCIFVAVVSAVMTGGVCIRYRRCFVRANDVEAGPIPIDENNQARIPFITSSPHTINVQRQDELYLSPIRHYEDIEHDSITVPKQRLDQPSAILRPSRVIHQSINPLYENITDLDEHLSNTCYANNDAAGQVESCSMNDMNTTIIPARKETGSSTETLFNELGSAPKHAQLAGESGFISEPSTLRRSERLKSQANY